MTQLSKIFIVIFILLYQFSTIASENDLTLNNLKKLYKDGYITEREYVGSKKIFLNQRDDKIKKIKKNSKFSKKIKDKKKSLSKIKEPITEEDIEKLGIYNKEKIYTDFAKYPEGMTEYFGGCKNIVCRGKKSGKFLGKAFGSKTRGQKYPGEMIKAMAMYELFYLSKLRETNEALTKYLLFKDDTKKKYWKKTDHEKKIRSLISINKGREKMREALGMSLETTTVDAITKFWILGEFLELGTPKKNEKYNAKLKSRQKLLDDYKEHLAKLKKQLESNQKKKMLN